MGCLNVLRLIAMSLFFGVLLNTSDQVSDLYLIMKTHLFNGSTLGMIACKYCDLNTISDSQMVRSNKCQVCTEGPSISRKGGLSCGEMPLALEKMTEYHNTCNQRNWSIEATPKSISKNSEDHYCRQGDDCCITSEVIDNVTRFSFESQRDGDPFIAERYKLIETSNKKDCEVTIITGVNGDALSCKSIFKKSNLTKSLKTECNNKEYYYDGENFVSGSCKIQNKCCVRTSALDSVDCKTKCNFKEHHLKKTFNEYKECCDAEKKLVSTHRRFRRCDKTACEMHIEFIKYHSSIVHDEASWRENFVTIEGNSLGGALCTYLKNLSLTMIIPILIHWVLVLQIWIDDLKSNKTTPFTFIFIIINCYSQWRLMKKIWNFYNNEERLQKELEENDLRVSSLESLFEAVLQVHIIYSIAVETEGTLPENMFGKADTRYITEVADILPLVKFIFGMICSSFGLSKFMVILPIRNKPCNSLFSFKFLALLMLNLMFIVRLYCIDNIFFTYYELIPKHSSDLEPKIIQPIIPQQYKYVRPLMLLFPSIASIAINLYHLKRTKVNVTKLLKTYPQLFILSGFSPFIFEGKAITDLSSNNEIPVQMSTSASVLNGIYIGIIPSIAFLMTEMFRGIVSFEWVGSKEFIQISETRAVYDVYAKASLNLLFSSFLANTIFAVSFIVLYIFLMLYFFGCNRQM